MLRLPRLKNSHKNGCLRELFSMNTSKKWQYRYTVHSSFPQLTNCFWLLFPFTQKEGEYFWGAEKEREDEVIWSLFSPHTHTLIFPHTKKEKTSLSGHLELFSFLSSFCPLRGAEKGLLVLFPLCGFPSLGKPPKRDFPRPLLVVLQKR